MLGRKQDHTPTSSTPLSSQQDWVPAPPVHQSTNQATSRLPVISTPHHWLLQLWYEFPSSQELPAAGWMRCLSIYWAWPMRIQAIQERVGYIPAGSSGWGRGASSCYTFCESAHMEGKGKQSRPTHPLQLVNTPLFSRCRAIHSMTYCLPDKIHTRPLH